MKPKEQTQIEQELGQWEYEISFPEPVVTQFPKSYT